MIPVLIGAVGGFVAARMIMRMRGRCGGGGWHRRGGFGFRGGPRRLFWMMRGLGLDRAQRDQVWQVAQKVRQAAGNLRFGRARGMDVLFDALTSEEFDRARVEAAANEQADAVAALRREIVEGVEKLHNVLTTEQRARLREFFGGGGGGDFEGPGGQHGGPYRTSL